MSGSEDEWLEKQIESEKSISELEHQIRQLKVIMHIFLTTKFDSLQLIFFTVHAFIIFIFVCSFVTAVYCFLHHFL